jgi:hypothetical protein
MVNVAQPVEHQIVALGVVGSIPTIHPTRRRALALWRGVRRPPHKATAHMP